ncbi:MAG: nitrous oxide reductase family maturation protein NosD [Syntrophobacteraceae bacterium]
MKRYSLALSSSFLLFLVLAGPLTFGVWAAPPPDHFYVSPTGVDGAARDGSLAEPWRHINYAVNRAEVGSGDIIHVLSDGVEGNIDYEENVIVNKSVKILADETATSPPVVKAASTTADAFYVGANNVEIKGLSIYGASGNNAAAIRLDNVTGCLIEANTCGLEPTKNNSWGILVYSGSQNVVKNNFASFNRYSGIDIFMSSANVVHGNRAELNFRGIGIIQAGSANIITSNTIRNNNLPDGGTGLQFGAVTNQNVASGNAIQENTTGVDLNGMAGGIVAANLITDSNTGLHVPSYSFHNEVFLNDFSANTSNIESETTNYELGSDALLFYKYNSSVYGKSLMGNFYSDYTGSDADGNGIGDTPYSAANFSDAHPLVRSPYTTGFYRMSGWALCSTSGGFGRLFENEFNEPGQVVTIGGSSAATFTTTVASPQRWVFEGGSTSAETTWTGWLTFASPPAAGTVVMVTLGISDLHSNFEPVGPSATVTGDGTNHIIHFVSEPGNFILPIGKYLAVRVANNSATSVQIMVGGMAGMLFAPERSHTEGYCPPLPLLLLE